MNKNVIKDVEPISTLLESLEDLGALPGKNVKGLYEIKPFRTWKNSPWKDRIFTMRLLNAGEIMEVTEQVARFDRDTRIIATRHELIIRSVFKIDNEELAFAEKVQDYNKNHNVELSALEYLRVWIKNVEQIVINQLDALIAELQLKQVRLLQGIHQCGVCTTVFAEVPKDAKLIDYSVHELICGGCLKFAEKSDWDFIGDTVEEEAEEAPAEKVEEKLPLSSAHPDDCYYCVCKKKFNTLEELTTHKVDCNTSKAAETKPSK